MALSTGQRVLFSLVPVVVLGLLGECGARVVGAPACEAIIPAATNWETMVGDPRLLWKLEPGRVFESPNGTSRVNAVGLRTALTPDQAKAADELRVLVTGDSSVYGWGQPDGQTYAEQLEAILEAMTPRHRVSVINLGVPGFSTEQTLRLLEDLGWSYEPDLLVVHNIFSDANIDAFQDRQAMKLADPDSTLGRRLLHRSRLYCAAYMPWARHSGGVNQEANRVLMPGRPVGANQAVTLERLDQVVDLSRVPLGHYLDNLETIREQAEVRGAAIMLAPLAQEWDVGLWGHDTPKPTEGRVLPWTAYREAQARYAAEQGIPRVYLPDAFAQATIDPRRLFIDHMHPSVAGAGVMARAVAEGIVEHPELLGLSAADLLPVPGSATPRGGGAEGGGAQEGGAQGGRPPGLPPGTARPPGKPPGTPPGSPPGQGPASPPTSP